MITLPRLTTWCDLLDAVVKEAKTKRMKDPGKEEEE